MISMKKNKSKQLRISAELHGRLRKLAFERNISMTKAAEIMIFDAMQKLERFKGRKH